MRKVAAGGWNDPLDPYDGLGAGDAGFIPGCGDPLYPFSVVVLGKFRRFLLVIFLSLFLHLDFSFIYSKFSMPFWGFFY